MGLVQSFFNIFESCHPVIFVRIIAFLLVLLNTIGQITVYLLIPILVPVAVIIKLQTLKFVNDKYWTAWSPIQYFLFIGFLNNLAGLVDKMGLAKNTLAEFLSGNERTE